MELIYESHFPFLLHYQLLFQGLADEKNQAEDGGGLSLSAEPGPAKEILLRTKRDPKNAGTRRDPKKIKKIKIQKKKDAWKRKQSNKTINTGGDTLLGASFGEGGSWGGTRCSGSIAMAEPSPDAITRADR